MIPVEVVPVKTTPPAQLTTPSSSTEPSGQTGDGAAPAVGPPGSGQQPESPAAPAVKPGETQNSGEDGANMPEVGGAAEGETTSKPVGEEEEDKWEPLPSVTTETPSDNSTTTPADGLSNMAALEQELLEMQYRDGRGHGIR